MKFLNLMCYFIWRFNVMFNRLIGRLVDALFKPFGDAFCKLPFVVRRFTKLHGSVENARKKIRDGSDEIMYKNRDVSVAMVLAWQLYGGVMVCYICGTFFFIAHYYKGLWDFLEDDLFYVIVPLSLAGCVTYFSLYRKDRYKKYFKEFDKLRGWKRLAGKICTLIFVFGSFAFMLWAIGFAL